MKKGIHPENYRPVVFKDMSNGDMFLSRSKICQTVTCSCLAQLLTQRRQSNLKAKLIRW